MVATSLEERLLFDAERRREPHWLYRMFDADGRLLYIGQTFNPRGRLAAWRSNAKTYEAHRWFHDVDALSWQQYPDWWSVCVAERAAIRTERPVHNRQHNVDAPIRRAGAA